MKKPKTLMQKVYISIALAAIVMSIVFNSLGMQYGAIMSLLYSNVFYQFYRDEK